MIPHINNIIKGDPLSIRELLHFIGLWLPVTYHPGYNRREFFADKSIDIFEGAPIRLNFYMMGNIFENIIASLSFTNITPPYFKEKFFEFLQMIVAWN